LIATLEGICNGSTSKLEISKNCKNTNLIFAIYKRTKACILGGRNPIFFLSKNYKNKEKAGNKQETL
jgi:hypothetical protein